MEIRPPLATRLGRRAGGHGQGAVAEFERGRRGCGGRAPTYRYLFPFPATNLNTALLLCAHHPPECSVAAALMAVPEHPAMQLQRSHSTSLVFD